MRSATTRKTIEQRRGSSLLEFLLLTPVWLLGFGAVLSTAFLFFGHSAMQVESFYLARAHLYGNQLGYCEASPSIWPAGFEPIYECPGDAEVRGRLAGGIRSHIRLAGRKLVP